MDKVNIRLNSFVSACATMQRFLHKHYPLTHDMTLDHDDRMGSALILIKHFELCYDLSWKCIKDYMYAQYGIEVASPKKAFQECVQRKMLNEQDCELLIGMVDDRNAATHTYDEKNAIELCNYIAQYHRIMELLIKVMQ